MKEFASSLFGAWFTPLVLPLAALSGCASGYDDPPPNTAEAQASQVETPSGPEGEEEEAAPPATPEPTNAPPPAPGASAVPPPPSPPAATAPAPPVTPPPPVASDARPVYTPTSAAPTGQWVYTDGYGWVWMPYEQAYTYVTPGQDDAYEYVYYPSSGWTWIHAPWVIGIGPRPYWGRFGPLRFSWYAHPWFHPRHVYYYRHPYHRGGRRGYRR